jgi:hypothetical protein
MEVEDHDLSAEEKLILDQRLAYFRQNPDAGIPAGQLKEEVLRRLRVVSV